MEVFLKQFASMIAMAVEASAAVLIAIGAMEALSKTAIRLVTLRLQPGE